jgi:hypothetical protein
MASFEDRRLVIWLATDDESNHAVGAFSKLPKARRYRIPSIYVPTGYTAAMVSARLGPRYSASTLPSHAAALNRRRLQSRLVMSASDNRSANCGREQWKQVFCFFLETPRLKELEEFLTLPIDCLTSKITA